MKKIYLYTNTFPPELGAAPSRLGAMAEALCRAGYHVEVFCAMPNYPKGEISQNYRGKWRITERWKNIRVTRHWLWVPKFDGWIARFGNMVSLFFSMLFTLPKALRGKPDMIIVQYPPLAVPLMALLLAKLSRSKLVLNCSDLWSFAISDLGLSKRRSILIHMVKKYERWLFSSSDWVLAQSEETKKHIEATAGKPVMLYRAGVDFKKYTCKQFLHDRKGKFRLVYIGVLGMAHGILELCKNVTLHDTELHIFGDGFEKKALSKYLSQSPNKSIILHEAISGEKIPQLLLQHDAMLVCQKKNIYGTLPSKTYEGMAAGLPIIYHGGGEGARLVETLDAGLVSDPHDWEQLRENIGKIVNMDALELKEIGQSGRNFIQQNADRNKIIEQFLSTLNEYLDK